MLLPVLALLAGWAGLVPPWIGQAAVIAVVAQTAWAVVLYRWLGLPLWYAACHPLGAAVMSWIAVVAAARGDAVAWAGRTYVAR